MAKRKRPPRQERYTEEIYFSCPGCYDRAQKGLRKAGIQFRTSFLKRLFFEQITIEIEQILHDLPCKFEIVKERS